MLEFKREAGRLALYFAGRLVAVQGMEANLIAHCQLQLQLFQDRVAVGGDQNLNAQSLQLQQDVNEYGEEFWVEVRFRLVPEEDGAVKQRSVLDEEPKKSQFA